MDQSKIDALIAKYHSWQNEIWLDVDEEIEDIITKKIRDYF